MLGVRTRRAALAGVAAATVLAASGTAVATAASVPSTARYACGKQCNGHSPSWAIPSNGVQCSKSGKVVSSGHPWSTSNSARDKGMTVTVYYSSVCQTLWEVVKNTGHPDYDPGDGFHPYWTMTRYKGYWYRKNGALPAQGHSVTTVMVDDAANGAKAAQAYVQEFTSSSKNSQHIYAFSY